MCVCECVCSREREKERILPLFKIPKSHFYGFFIVPGSLLGGQKTVLPRNLFYGEGQFDHFSPHRLNSSCTESYRLIQQLKKCVLGGGGPIVPSTPPYRKIVINYLIGFLNHFIENILEQ